MNQKIRYQKPNDINRPTKNINTTFKISNIIYLFGKYCAESYSSIDE